MTADYADWHVEYIDADEGLVLEEVFVGLSSPAAVSRRITHRLDIDPKLANVAGWNVRVIAVDN